MITYNGIGHFGRLANQMFQFASTYGIAKKCGYDVAFPIENTTVASVEDFKDGVTREVYFDIPSVFDIPKELLKNRFEIFYDKEVQEPHFHFTEEFFKVPDNTNLKGYYQTEKYFEHCKEDIKKLFTFKPEIKREALEKFPKVYSDTVSLHIRVGDYIGLQDFHPICDADYYIRATQHFKDDNYYFMIFSDNIEYCKNIFGESENIIFIEGNSPEVDLCLMSLCEHNIIANSSFSWWAAWLNSNPYKKIIAPKQWFGPAYHYQNTNDLYCENWIKE